MRFSSFSRRSFFIVTFKSAQCLQPREVAMIHRHPSDRCHCHVLNVSHHVTNIHQDTSCLKEDVWVSKWEHPNSPSMSKFDGAHGEQWTLGTHRFWTWSFEKAVPLWSRHLVANLGVLPKRLPQNGQHSVNLTCCQNLGSSCHVTLQSCCRIFDNLVGHPHRLDSYIAPCPQNTAFVERRAQVYKQRAWRS